MIEKWQFYPTFRYFCGEDASIEGAGAFPIPLYSLTILANELNGRGNEAMISALLEATTDDMPLEMMAIH